MSKLHDRLTSQLAAKGMRNASGMATTLLTKAGDMAGGKLTAKGKERQAMGAAGRAKDRAAKYNGGKPADYHYNAKTNRATKGLGMVKK